MIFFCFTFQKNSGKFTRFSETFDIVFEKNHFQKKGKTRHDTSRDAPWHVSTLCHSNNLYFILYKLDELDELCCIFAPLILK